MSMPARLPDPLIVVADAEGRLSGDLGAPPVLWWSFTKSLIAFAALRLATAGRIDLDAPLAGRRYALRHLLMHTAGLGDYGSREDYHAAVARGEPAWSDAEVYARVPPDRLAHAPGDGWAYSNVGHLLVRRRLEEVTGHGLARILGDLVFGPLGLTRSRLAETAADIVDLAFPTPPGYDPGWVLHGAVVGPVEEAALALHGLLIGDPPVLAARPRRPIDPATTLPPWVDPGYGLGLMIGRMAPPDGGEPVGVVGHSAGGPGSVGAVYASRGSRPTVVACFGAGDGVDRVESEVARRLAAHR
jgi:CubicO group peptidase (beta-lactamase class C family)